MDKQYLNACMNPIRQRIVQYILAKGSATTTEIGVVLSDVPRASLYRHIKILLEANVIRVEKEEAKRGRSEKTYVAIKQTTDNQTNDDMDDMAQKILMSISGELNHYFSSEDADPVRDMFTIRQSVVLMSDREMKEFYSKMEEILKEIVEHKPTKSRKERKITLMVTPTNNPEE